MNGKRYVVSVWGKIWVETTVAVIAESEEEASRLALSGLRVDTDEWVHWEGLIDEPVVTDVSFRTIEEDLEWADQKHLVGPRLK